MLFFQLSIFPAAALGSAILIVAASSVQQGFMISNSQVPNSRIPVLGRVDSLIGIAACAGAALGTSALASGHSWQVWVPLGFSALLLFIAWFSGARVGILGTLLAAAVFAFFLFSPVGSLRVASSAARTNLGWMLLIGITFSLLFAPPTSGSRRRENAGQTTERDSPAS